MFKYQPLYSFPVSASSYAYEIGSNLTVENKTNIL